MKNKKISKEEQQATIKKTGKIIKNLLAQCEKGKVDTLIMLDIVKQATAFATLEWKIDYANKVNKEEGSMFKDEEEEAETDE